MSNAGASAKRFRRDVSPKGSEITPTEPRYYDGGDIARVPAVRQIFEQPQAPYYGTASSLTLGDVTDELSANGRIPTFKVDQANRLPTPDATLSRLVDDTS